MFIKPYGGAIGTELVLSKEEISGASNLTDADKQAANKATKIKYFRVTMLCGSDQGRYCKLVEDLKNSSPRFMTNTLPILHMHKNFL